MTEKEQNNEMKNCPYCAEKIKEEAVFCKYCKKDISGNTPTEQKSSGGTPTCPVCGGEMGTSVKSHGGWGCLIILVGLLFLPVFGLGIIVIIVGLIIGMKKQGFWVCKKCGHILPRQVGFFE